MGKLENLPERAEAGFLPGHLPPGPVLFPLHSASCLDAVRIGGPFERG